VKGKENNGIFVGIENIYFSEVLKSSEVVVEMRRFDELHHGIHEFHSDSWD
jgi:hypothetical protein